MNTKMYITNLILLLAIIGLGYLVATTRYEPPERTYAVESHLSKELEGGIEAETEYSDSSGASETIYATPRATPKKTPVVVVDANTDKYKQFGKAPIFNTIIPKPTKPPTPTKPPPKPPDINRPTARWKLQWMMGGQASFYDTGSKEEWIMKVGDVKKIRYRNYDCPIKLESVDETTLKVKISFGDQTRDFSMF